VKIKPETTPIYQTSVFTFEDLNDLEGYFEQPDKQYMYTRFGNPNSDELAKAVAELEGGSGAVVTSSGTSGILVAMLTYCKAGDHVLYAEELYGGSIALLNNELSQLGITATSVPNAELYNLDGYVQETTKLLLAETISNPFVQVLDIARLAAETKQRGIKLVIDNTFATPVLTKPLALGTDMVIHSVTKYLSGHSDVSAGVVVCKNEADFKRTQQLVRVYGLNLSPFESWLGARGLKTLKLRMKQQCANGLAIAKFLDQHKNVERVWFPGLKNHPQHELAQEQGNGLFGAMISFKLKDDLETVNKFMQNLQHILFTPSLAGINTSISHPERASHRSISAEQRKKLGITLGIIRLSVGIEEPEELIADLEQALAAM
jgi:cystathionine beta-lyase/cystathionine gamma-synthase